MGSRAIKVMQWVSGLAFLGFMAAVLFPVFARHRGEERVSCQSNLKQIMLGLIAYEQDYDNRFPPARGYGKKGDASYGWAGCSQPYLKSIQILVCPQYPSARTGSSGDSGFSDYYLNARLSQFNVTKLVARSNTIALGDGNDGVDLADAAYSKSFLPPDWQVDTTKPSFRHLSGANCAFADGHVKWLAPTAITDATASSSVVTFAVE